MPATKIFWHGPYSEDPVPLSDCRGPFQTDSAYVIVADAPRAIYVLQSPSLDQTLKDSATKHASELANDEILVQYEEHGKESAAFNAIFVDIEQSTDSLVDLQAILQADAPVADNSTATSVDGAKKKKNKKKKKKGSNENEPAPEADNIETSAEEDITVEEDVVAGEKIVVEEESKATEAAEANTIDEKAVIAEPTEEEKAVIAELKNNLPEEVPPSVTAIAPEKDDEDEKATTTENNTTTPVRVNPTLAAAMTPKPTTSTTTVSTTASPSILASKSYLADSAKAWGGASTVPAVPSSDVKFAPGSKYFPYEELKVLRADSGIDMTAKEKYLSDDDFVKVFKKDRAAYLAQPLWRQQLQKKDVGLW